MNQINRENISLFKLSKLIYQQLSYKRKRELILVIFFMLLNSFSAVINLAIIIPFITIISNPEKIWNLKIISLISKTLNIQNTESLTFFITISFIFSILLSALTRLITLFLSNRLSASVGSDLSYAGFSNILKQSFEWHIYEKSSNIISSLTDSINKTVSYIRYNLELITSFLILLVFSISLFILEPYVFVFSLLIVTSLYLLIILFVRKKLDFYSRKIKKGNIKIVEVTQDSIGSIVNIKIDNTYKNFLNLFKNNEIPLRIYTSDSNFISQFPKYIIEAFSLVLIISLAYILSIKNNDSFVIQKIGIIAFAAQKMLPEFQKIFASWAQLKTTKSSAIQIINILKINSNIYSNNKKIITYQTKNKIDLKGISYFYPDKTLVLRNLNFSIKVGEKIGIIGETGCGKSTFLNIFMGLLEPTKGKIFIDGINPYLEKNKDFIQRYQMSISYVPQTFYISAGTIIDNIAYGQKKEDYDFEKAFWAAEIAQMFNFLEQSVHGLNMKVGERGINLSGGQKQRLIIARALYKEAKIIIFDEATSALDEKTEAKLLEELYKLNTTNIFVSHKLSTLNSCDRIVCLKKGIFI